MRRPLLAIGLAVVATFPAGGLAAASRHTVALEPCTPRSAVLCTTVRVPLDRSRRRPGSIDLHVEVLPAAGSAGFERGRRTIFLVSGGPGQASAEAFGLADFADYWQPIFPGFQIVAFDDRGTGRSGPLSCPGLAAIVTEGVEQTARAVGRCGTHLGARGAFFSTRANADDTDAVRAALGVARISLYGVSYGSKQIVAYALRHGAHVDRLVLDSVAPVSGTDWSGSGTLRAIPGSLGSLCARGACPGSPHDLGARLAALANRLDANPLVGTVPRPGRRAAHVRLDGLLLVELALDADLNPGIAAELPAALGSALDGRPGPLLRLSALDTIWGSALFEGINLAVNVATECNDGFVTFPWPAGTPVGQRGALLREAIAARPARANGPFGAWASTGGLAQQCLDWPRPAARVDLGAARLPDVPVLVLSGDRDVRTPPADARRVAAGFRRHRLLLVHRAGHDVLDASPCAQRFVAAWLIGVRHGSCPAAPALLTPLGPFPESAPGGGRRSPAATLLAVAETMHEAEATWLATYGVRGPIAGLAGGRLQPRPDEASFSLSRYALGRGVAIDGVVGFDPAATHAWSGRVTISGSGAAEGSLTLAHGRIAGTLGGRFVSRPAG